MNRKNFLRLLGIGSVAAVVAPRLLTQEPDFAQKIINLKPSYTPLDAMTNHIEGVGCYSEQEALARLQLQMDFERSIFFGERRIGGYMNDAGGWIPAIASTHPEHI